MDPRLIRANIALFKGKRFETKRLLDEYVVDQENPDQARRDPMLLWLDAHAQPRHDGRVGGLRTLTEHAPPDSSYHHMARGFLQEEEHYASLLDPAKKRRSGLRPWQIVGGLLMVGLVGVTALILMNQPAPVIMEATEEPATEEPTAEPTALPTLTPTPVQNTPAPIRLADDVTPSSANFVSEREQLAYDGNITILNIDSDIRFVVDESGNQVLPADFGAKFYGLLLEFRCDIPICNNVPEAELSVELGSDGFRIVASEGLSIAMQPTLAPRVSQGNVSEGWVVFEVPRINAPTSLVIRPNQDPDSEEEPVEIEIPLS